MSTALGVLLRHLREVFIAIIVGPLGSDLLLIEEISLSPRSPTFILRYDRYYLKQRKRVGINIAVTMSL
jgi:hypothetical protein